MLNFIAPFLFIIFILAFFPFLDVYGDLEYTKFFCDLHGYDISETEKSCAVKESLRPYVTDSNFVVEKFVSGLEFPVSMDFVGDDILVLEKHSGKVMRISENGVVYDNPVLDVSVRYNYYSGLLGITTLSDRVFLYYTEPESGSDVREGRGEENSVNAKNRVYQYDWDGEKLTNPVLIKEFIAQLANNHHGGAITKGLDNEIYFVIGDEGQSGIFENRAENPCYIVYYVNEKCSDEIIYETSSIFKIHTDEDNRVELFAMGIRNSFGLAVDPVTGYLWDTENGDNYYDEINLVKPGFNSGWNSVMGPSDRENPDTHPCAAAIQTWRHHDEPPCQVEHRGFQPIPPAFEDFIYSEPEFSWYLTVGPTAVSFSDKIFGYTNTLFIADYHTATIYKFPLNSDRTGFNLYADLEDKVADDPQAGQVQAGLLFAYNFPGGITDIKFHNGAMYAVALWDGSIYKIYRIEDVEVSIPSWVRNNAEWWALERIDDNAYVRGLQWLISNGIIVLPITEQTAQAETNVIPAWVKTNATWWAVGQIDDNAYVTGLQWLISNGIIIIK